MNPPVLCRPEAYYKFADSLHCLHTSRGLQKAAVAIAMHAFDDIDPASVDAHLDALAERVLARVRRRNPETLIAHLHDVLFDEEQFHGESNNYYSPLNSYLPAVLATRRGLPITLALTYKFVGERIGLEIDGINAPGHFLARVRDSRGWLLVDPFHGGKVLTSAEVYALVERVFNARIQRTPEVLEPATHKQWLTRLLANLQKVFSEEGCNDDLAAMTELQSLLDAAR
ncbi:MAG TPA: transglutaminase-like domain-containing protein [Pirellulaceae bacterium]|nr:transglutaminase-like domain-containing protein [Pirellulaceae bacterium]